MATKRERVADVPVGQPGRCPVHAADAFVALPVLLPALADDRQVKTKCAFSNHLIDSDDPEVYQRMCGWQRAGGKGPLLLREPQYEWACAAHVEAEVKGLKYQPELF